MKFYSYINSQLALESEARELMPYSFAMCTNPLGALRQPVFSCKTCQSTSTPGPSFPSIVRCGAAAICYSCSIACHGDHELVEIFNKRDVVCDCGTDRMPRGSSCALRKVAGEKPREGNRYCHNYWGRFCACDADYDPESEKGTMYQCLLGDACGEDWFHDGCIVGEKRDESKRPAVEGGVVAGPEITAQCDRGEDGPEEEDEDEERPDGFPEEDSFDAFICWLCVEKNPWLKRYAGTPGFLDAVYKKDSPPSEATTNKKSNVEEASSVSNEAAEAESSKKRKADDVESDPEPKTPRSKRAKTPDPAAALSSSNDTLTDLTPQVCTHEFLSPPMQTTKPFSLFLAPTFRAQLCHCPIHLPFLYPHPVLLEEEDTYEPPLDTSSTGDDAASAHSGNSLLDRGERALGMVDRVKAIEGVMAYNDLKEKVKGFLKPFAERGEAVGVEDVKRYFAELRGDVPVVKGKEGEEGDSRREQSGELSSLASYVLVC